ncbi:hypothetical protein [Schleiferilactobacillus shenzhenensis]|uniref:Uncharacterized protein n=1 Tax=Schleiferilactobacillus shenzhenensis LY-73 TaxID=1231336 RepID=U4TNH6_9LACO|nr:hypothetical protein [Schleiferilactobacillus shenzhenensis]ERL64980.1 hypothetical protein L248_3142 [Schleiferilactobacillus shenzhenensis LY-73]
MKHFNHWRITAVGALLLAGVCLSAGQASAADDAPLTKAAAAPIEAVAQSAMTQRQVIHYLAKQEGISLAQAKSKLLPSVSVKARPKKAAASYAVVRVALMNASPARSPQHYDAGTVYFYCTTSESGLFRGIKMINYTSYSAGRLNFVGQLNYMLIDPNIIHLTLNGAIQRPAAVTVSHPQRISLGQAAAITIGMARTTAFVDNLFVDTNYTF